MRPWQAQEPLTQSLKGILKQTENVLREKLQFKSKLRGIDLPPAWVAAIEQALRPPVSRRTVAIDFDSIASLKRDSEQIRQRLLVEDETPPILDHQEAATEVNQSQNAPYAVPKEQRTTVPKPENDSADSVLSYTERPEGTPEGLLTDLKEIAAIMGASSSAESQLLSRLRKYDWQASATRLNQETPGVFLNLLFDQINERAVIHLGDALVFDEDGMWVVGEDYRDEIAYILDHPAYGISDNPKKVESSINVATLPSVLTLNGNANNTQTEADKWHELPTEWLQLSDRLQQQHWAVLTILLQEKNVNTQIDAIARQRYTTANQLLDQINEFALESIGDILIHVQDSKPLLEDEYQALLQHICDLHSSSTPLVA